MLSRTSDAIDTLTGALSKANLAAEKGLNDALVEAYGGFPETVRTLSVSRISAWLIFEIGGWSAQVLPG